MSLKTDNPILASKQIMLAAVAAGLLTGLGEVAMRGLQRYAGIRTWLSSDVVWMAPLADVVMFSIAGAALCVLARLRGRDGVARNTVVWLLGFLALVGFALAYPRLHPFATVVLSLGAARLLTPLLAPFVTGPWARATAAAATTVILVVVAIVVVRRGLESETTVENAGGPNVLLLVLDTVRSEDLSAYGYEHDTSPNLASLADEGVLFERAYSTAPWTLTAHASLFTGQYAGDSSADWSAPLGPQDLTLAEWLARRGYDTGGFAANLIYATREMGLHRGFHHYEDYPVSWQMVANSSLLARRLVLGVRRAFGVDGWLVYKSATRMRENALRWIDGTDGPFFAFVNFMDAHAPYLPPAEFEGRFGPVRTWSAEADLSLRDDWTPEQLAAERAAYDGAIAYVDQQVGLLLEGLRERGLLDETIVIVTSDHGEQFGEKGLVDHGNSLYRTTLEVPLILFHRGVVPAGVRVDRPVTIRDIPQTLADLVAGERVFPGSSLAEAWRDGTAEPSVVLSEVNSGVRMPAWTPVARGDMVAVVTDGLHYVRNGDGVEELYALTDRAHESDLSATDPVSLGRMRSLADSLTGGGRTP